MKLIFIIMLLAMAACVSPQVAAEPSNTVEIPKIEYLKYQLDTLKKDIQARNNELKKAIMADPKLKEIVEENDGAIKQAVDLQKQIKELEQ